MTHSTVERLIVGSAFALALSGCASPGVTKILSETSLVSVVPGFNSGSSGVVSRFLWEPNRYAPPATEIFFEVVGGVFGAPGLSATFRLHNVTTNTPIANSSLVVNSGAVGRFRTASLTASFPSTPAEISLVVEVTPGATFSIQRSAVLVQQQ